MAPPDPAGLFSKGGEVIKLHIEGFLTKPRLNIADSGAGWAGLAMTITLSTAWPAAPAPVPPRSCPSPDHAEVRTLESLIFGEEFPKCQYILQIKTSHWETLTLKSALYQESSVRGWGGAHGGVVEDQAVAVAACSPAHCWLD